MLAKDRSKYVYRRNSGVADWPVLFLSYKKYAILVWCVEPPTCEISSILKFVVATWLRSSNFINCPTYQKRGSTVGWFMSKSNTTHGKRVSILLLRGSNILSRGSNILLRGSNILSRGSFLIKLSFSKRRSVGPISKKQQWWNWEWSSEVRLITIMKPMGHPQSVINSSNTAIDNWKMLGKVLSETIIECSDKSHEM